MYPRKKNKALVRYIINKKGDVDLSSLLSIKEQQALQLAQDNEDFYWLEGNSSVDAKARVWEQTLYSYLDKRGITYFTEQDLKDRNYTATSDCLICVKSNNLLSSCWLIIIRHLSYMYVSSGKQCYQAATSTGFISYNLI